jgi:hypothetical protein
MKNKITLSLCLLLIISSLSAQSKKELDLRIDTLQTALNNEKQVVQNLTLQIQDLTTELEKINKGILLLTSQVVKQDSMKNNLQKQIHTLFENLESIKRVNDSIVKVTEKNISDSILIADKIPEITARPFLEALLKKDYVNAKKYCCCEMIEILNSKPTLLQLEKSFADDKITIEGIGNSKIYYNDNEKNSCSIEFETFVNGKRKDGIGLKMKKKNNLWFVSEIK